MAESRRDLRIDYIRGMIMMIVITVHMEYYSLYSFLVWERVGVISSAEGFVAMSGMVLGMVYGAKLHRDGFAFCAGKMFDRSIQLYRVAITVVLLVAALNLLPFIDAQAIMQWVNPGTKEVFPLYPSAEAPLKFWVKQILLLRSGPHQFQVMGLYFVLLLAAPLILFALHKGRALLVIGLSWVLYALFWAAPMRPTGAQFEYAFPLLAWQLLFVHAMVLGFHKDTIFSLFSGTTGRVAFWIALAISTGFWLYAMNNPNPVLPDWAKLDWIDSGTFYQIHGEFFSKSKLGLGRIANNLALFMVVMGLLTRFWVPLQRAFGWLFIPIGQASLYVFIVHVFFVLAASLTPWHEAENFWANTLMHTAAIAAIWFMVKNKVLYGLIPR
ncbi:MAG: OpgC domain-containing protein [Pseudomonadota bacterium]